MVDLIIRGMEMQKSCIDCPIMVDRFDTDACALQSEEANEAFESWEDMRRNCPLLPLPAGHGRLIDADKMRESIRRQAGLLKLMGGELAEIAETLEKGFLQEIDNAPTIVPAEGGGEE